METYFNVRYEFDKKKVHEAVDLRLKEEGSDYICVSDGVVLNSANRDPEYLNVVNGGMFSICDSSFVPLYLKWLYRIKREQYCGSQIFHDYVFELPPKRMIFLGGSQSVLDGLKKHLTEKRPDIADMKFVELPFLGVEAFDYPGIAKMIEEDGADIIWVALGAPKQEKFMSRLKPYLSHGVMMGVGAVFKFYSGLEASRAPKWMVDRHMEFIYRIFSEPKKQLKRCGWIIATLPGLLLQEHKRKKLSQGHYTASR
ncbi:MAG: WecB/TagA/CpsF family glycosyltransferase [Clostridia bacterium]|nr:WecB/TagA/CpsF family glycosyltransferase [Clostridia bacterium]